MYWNVQPRRGWHKDEQARKFAGFSTGIGKALGLALAIDEVPYGIRFDVTANGVEGEARLGGVQRFTMQLETASKGLFVTVLMNMPGSMGILESMGIEPDSDAEKLFKKQVEQWVGAPEGKCRLL